ncbi:MAG: hypothetical protein AB7L91_03225 [Dehalococcoidia bacterium]
MDLSTMRTRVRRDLRDEDAANYRWTDAELDRHIARAVQEVSLAAPLEASTTLMTAAGSREVSIATLTSRVSVEAAEYPVDQYPRSLVPFTTWADTLSLLIDGAPLEGEPVLVRYTKLHTLDGSGTTLPDRLHDLVATGAGAYAALEWASYATNRVNVGGAETWRNYHTWAQERMAAFAKSLAKLGRERRLRSHRMYQSAVGAAGARE